MLRWAFRGLFNYFGHPHCKVLKDGNWLITFKGSLTPVATTEAIDICAKAGLQIKHSAEHSDTGSAFRLDIDNLDLNNSSFAWLDGIDTDAIKARLEAEQNKTANNNDVKPNINEENSMKDYKFYDLNLEATPKNNPKGPNYTDSDNVNHGILDDIYVLHDFEYDELVAKLNQIAKTHDINMMVVSRNGKDLFYATSFNSDDPFDDTRYLEHRPLVRFNKLFTKNEPFMSQFEAIGLTESYKHTTLNSLSEEFKLFENMWDDEAKELTETSVGVSAKSAKISELRAKIAQLQQELDTLIQDDIEDFSSFELDVDGTSKKLKRIGLPHAQALDEIVDFITKLTSEEKDNLTLYWSNDMYEAGDLEGDVIVNFDCKNYYLNEIGMSQEAFEADGLADPANRVIDNTWTAEVPEDAYDRIVAALKN